MGRDRERPIRRDWEEVKDDIMRAAVLQKFKSNVDIMHILLCPFPNKINSTAPAYSKFF